ncbi:MAG: single-stranded DNA-binding protein [Phycisphaerales bacterium]
MAGSFNQVILMGNLTRDVELKFTPSNKAVAKIGLAVNERWTTPEGEKKESVTFVDCEAWGKTAEIMGKYLAKGRPVFIVGRLKLDTWQDKESGQNRSKMKVVIESFQFVDSAGGGQRGGPGGNEGGADEGGGGPSPQVRTNRAPAGAGPTIEHDDIPF